MKNISISNFGGSPKIDFSTNCVFDRYLNDIASVKCRIYSIIIKA